MMQVAQKGDCILVTMIDRLGRSASDVLNIVEEFKAKGIKLKVLQFDGIDLTSSTGKLLITMLAAVAEMERNMLIERTVAGLERTKSQGTKLGPPLTISPETMENLCNEKEAGNTLDQLQSRYGIPRNTIARNITKWKGSMEAYRAEWEARQTQYSKTA
jgi:DNA invertase Pin-like site-specific DNA recombinase